jgi:IS5 family transposase
VDTTVQEKNVRFPTDARLLDRSRERLVKRARAEGIVLRQTFSRMGKRALRQQSGYAHAKQFKRARREEKKLRTFLGRVVRDVERKCKGVLGKLEEEVEKARRLLAQKRTDSNKLYSLHEPHVECIAKGKAHKRYEFGCKASFVSAARSNWILGAKAFHGNPYDGHTLAAALAQSARLTGVAARQAVCDLGYRGHDYTGACDVQIVKRHRKGLPKAMRRWWKRRSAIEPVIGHLKAESRMDRNRLAGKAGDRLNAILSACGFNLRKLLRGFASFLRFLHCAWLRLGPVLAATIRHLGVAA